MKKIKFLSLIALSLFVFACTGEKEESKPAETPVAESTSVPGDKVSTDQNAEKVTETPTEESTESVVQQEVVENAEKATDEAVKTVEGTTDKLGVELDKVGDKAKEKIDEGIDKIKEKIAN